MSRLQKLCFRGPPWIYIIMIAIVLLVLGTLMVLWQKSQNDYGHHLEFRIENISLSSFDWSENQASGYWNVVFSVKNRFKYDVFYPRIDTTLFYKKKLLATTSIAAFDQKKSSEMLMNAEFVAFSVNSSDKEVRSYFLSEKNNGSVSFDFVLNVGYHMEGKQYLRDAHLDVICKDVRIGFSLDRQNASLLDGKRNCQLYL